MKIAIITDILYPARVGGTSIVPYNLSNYFKKKGLDITLFGNLPKDFKKKDIKKYYPGIDLVIFEEKNILDIFLNQFKIFKEISKKKFDIIHMEMLPGIRMMFFLSKIKNILNYKTKIVQKIHGYPPIESTFKNFNFFMRSLYHFNWFLARRNININSDFIIVNSNYIKNLVKHDFPAKKIGVIPNGIDLKKWKKVKSSQKNLSKEITFWGRLSNEKGVDIVIQAMKKVIEKKENCKLKIIGKGKMKEDYSNLVKKLEIEDKVEFLGELDQETIVKIASSSDVLVFPSRYESFGMMILEGMSLGIPLISTNIGGIPEIIKDGINGKLVNPDPIELANSILKVLQDEKLAKKLVSKSIIQIKKYEWSNIIKEYENLYKSLISEKNGKN